MPLPPPGWRLRIEESLPSTQDLLLRLAAAGEPEGLALLARRQSAGRGQEGRGWQSPSGNLHLSILLRPRTPAREAGQWSLRAGVALAEALSPWAPDPAAIRLKWPNDLLLDGGKLAGVLTETSAGADGALDWVVIGFGANLAEAPAIEGRATACLGGKAPAPDRAAIAVLHAMEAWRARDFAAVRAAWLARGPAPGTPLGVRGGAGSRRGVYAGLSADGSLLLDSGEGPRPFTAGQAGED